MFIFRVEHDREVCTYEEFKLGGKSLTGHGPLTGWCGNPNYGYTKSPPLIRMMPHERCAVTALQFDSWISEDWECKNVTTWCNGKKGYCKYCGFLPQSRNLYLPDGWSIVSYWVEDDKDGIDWRIDNGQVVFNPEFAFLIGKVQLAEVEAMV